MHSDAALDPELRARIFPERPLRGAGERADLRQHRRRERGAQHHQDGRRRARGRADPDGHGQHARTSSRRRSPRAACSTSPRSRGRRCRATAEPRPRSEQELARGDCRRSRAAAIAEVGPAVAVGVALAPARRRRRSSRRAARRRRRRSPCRRSSGSRSCGRRSTASIGRRSMPVLRAREVRDRVGGGDPAVAVVVAEDVAARAAGQVVVRRPGRSARRPRCRPRARRHPTRRRGYRRPTRPGDRVGAAGAAGPVVAASGRRCGPRPCRRVSRSSPPRPSSRLSASIAAAKSARIEIRFAASSAAVPARQPSPTTRTEPSAKRSRRAAASARRTKPSVERGAAGRKAHPVGGVRDGEPGRRDRSAPRPARRRALGSRPRARVPWRRAAMAAALASRSFSRARHRHDDPVRRVIEGDARLCPSVPPAKP